jgi:sodium/potassium-transporting ATPase subunit beta
MALNQKPVEYQFYLRPPTLGKWEAFKLFLYNSSTGEVLGRTGPSWGKQY